MTDHRILTGNDRTKFVNTVMKSTFNPESCDQEAMKISKKVMTKVKGLVAMQSDKSHLDAQCLPPMPKAYKEPVIQCRIDNVRNNCFVCTNDTHSRQTNNGFKRLEGDGRFFSH